MDISLYFHIPFCQKKCPYCHFFSFTPNESHIKNYMQALFLEYKQKENFLKNANIISIYFGGGTPTFLNEKHIATILNWISQSSFIPSYCEITIETNPNINLKKIYGLKKTGINRISMGAQSLDDNDLKILKRDHTKKDVINTLDNLSKHFENISIDIMYDIPYQTKANFSNTLQEIEKLPINHVSLYNLTFETNTLFYRKKEKLLPFVPNSCLSLEMLDMAIDKFKKMGLERYEISAFAKDNKISIHNSGYWTGRAFLGLGPSAFSYFNKKRFQNSLNFNQYVQNLKNHLSPVCFEEQLKYPDNINELLAVNLRLTKGIDLKRFQKKWKKLPESTLQKLCKLEKENFVIKKNNTIFLSEKGLLFYDNVAETII